MMETIIDQEGKDACFSQSTVSFLPFTVLNR
jgi:hypothetical protein